MIKSGAIVLLSGGMDSAFCLHWALRSFTKVWAVFVHYGQRNAKHEELAAHRIAAIAEVPLSIYSMQISWNATLCALSRPLRSGTDEDGFSHAFVPGRNLHLLTVAASRTREVDANAVVIGCCLNDAEAFPDCRPGFLAASSAVLSLAYAKPIRVVAPAVRLTKTDLLLQARGDEATWRSIRASWSCYTPTQAGAPCGECDACGHRDRAFAALESEPK